MRTRSTWLWLGLATTAWLLACGTCGGPDEPPVELGEVSTTLEEAPSGEVGATAGTWEVVSGDWAATESIVALDGKLYVVCNGLYEVDPATGAYERLGTGEWAGAKHMAALGEHLYLVHEGTIYKTDKQGSWEELTSDWGATEAIVGLGDQLYVVCNGLYAVDPGDGTYERLGTGEWSGARHMAALGDHLYLVHEGTIYKTDKAGAWETLADDYAATESMAALDGFLYLVCNGLYRVDPSSGEYLRIGTDKWDGAGHMAALGGKLYMVHAGTIYRTAVK